MNYSGLKITNVRPWQSEGQIWPTFSYSSIKISIRKQLGILYFQTRFIIKFHKTDLKSCQKFFAYHYFFLFEAFSYNDSGIKSPLTL